MFEVIHAPSQALFNLQRTFFRITYIWHHRIKLDVSSRKPLNLRIESDYHWVHAVFDLRGIGRSLGCGTSGLAPPSRTDRTDAGPVNATAVRSTLSESDYPGTPGEIGYRKVTQKQQGTPNHFRTPPADPGLVLLAHPPNIPPTHEGRLDDCPAKQPIPHHRTSYGHRTCVLSPRAVEPFGPSQRSGPKRAVRPRRLATHSRGASRARWAFHARDRPSWTAGGREERVVGEEDGGRMRKEGRSRPRWHGVRSSEDHAMRRTQNTLEVQRLYFDRLK